MRYRQFVYYAEMSIYRYIGKICIIFTADIRNLATMLICRYKGTPLYSIKLLLPIYRYPDIGNSRRKLIYSTNMPK